MEAFEPFLFRAVKPADLDAIFAFTQTAGLTHLPPDRTLLENLIKASIRSFSTTHTQPSPNDIYFCVLEDTETHRIAGCSAIYADVGHDTPYFTFKRDQDTLLLNSEIKDVTEMGALYLAPEYRHHHLGKFISRARFLFMAAHPKFFHDIVIADMRGRLDNQQRSPFWEEFSHHYVFNKSFMEADLEIARHHAKFIDRMMPHQPIALSSLSQRARACIGLIDRATRPAVRFLTEEHFIPSTYINVFDGGPLMMARASEINIIVHSHVKKYLGASVQKAQTLYFIATQSTDFRVAVSPVTMSDNGCTLPSNVAQQLNLSPNDLIRIAPF